MVRLRTAAWAAVAVLVIAMGGFLVLRGTGGLPKSLPLSLEIGGPFELTDFDGGKVSSASLKGTPFALFFGFTFCPDVCPTTMLDLTRQIERLGPEADRMRFYFVSVDTERDTPEQLKLYLSNFDKRIVGLTGSPAEIASVAKAYRAYYEKVPTKDGFTYNHTALVYLMRRDGKFGGTIAYQEKEDVAVEKLKRLIATP